MHGSQLGMILAATAVLACGSGYTEDESPQVSGCEPGGDTVAVTRARVGPIRLTAPLDSLRRLCPQARDSVLVSGEGYESPAVYVEIGSLRLLGVQYQVDLVGEAPADYWIVEGEGGRLPRGGGLDWTWRELREVYEDATASAGIRWVRVRFASLPGLTFELDAEAYLIEDFGWSRDVSRIPDAARIVEVLIEPDAGTP